MLINAIYALKEEMRLFQSVTLCLSTICLNMLRGPEILFVGGQMDF